MARLVVLMLAGCFAYAPPDWPLAGEELDSPCVDGHEPNQELATAARFVPGADLLIDLEDDWWAFDVPAGATLQIDARFLHADGNLELSLVSGTREPLDFSGTVSDDETVAWTNRTGSDATVYLHVFLFALQPRCVPYTLETTLTSTCAQDPFEPNDTVETRAILGPMPVVVQATAGAGDIDVYEVYVPFTEELLVEVASPSTTTTTILDSDGNGPTVDGPSLAIAGPTDLFAGEAFTITVEGTSCEPYTLHIDACRDDGFEPNDAMGSATSLSRGLVTGLDVRPSSADWYRLPPVGAFETVWIDALFLHADGNLDLTLFRPSGQRAIGVVGGRSTTDDESLSWTNGTSASVRPLLRVEATNAPACGVPYALDVVSP